MDMASHSNIRIIVFHVTKSLVDELLKSMSHHQSIFHLKFFPNAFPCLVGSLNGSLMCSTVHCSIKHLEMDGIIGFSSNFIFFYHLEQADKMWTELEVHRKKLARAETIFENSKTVNKPEGTRPLHRTGTLGLVGTKVDSIDF